MLLVVLASEVEDNLFVFGILEAMFHRFFFEVVLSSDF